MFSATVYTVLIQAVHDETRSVMPSQQLEGSYLGSLRLNLTSNMFTSQVIYNQLVTSDILSLNSSFSSTITEAITDSLAH